jgi:hypothetical protein
VDTDHPPGFYSLSRGQPFTLAKANEAGSLMPLSTSWSWPSFLFLRQLLVWQWPLGALWKEGLWSHVWQQEEGVLCSINNVCHGYRSEQWPGAYRGSTSCLPKVEFQYLLLLHWLKSFSLNHKCLECYQTERKGHSDFWISCKWQHRISIASVVDKNQEQSWEWWCMSIIPTVGRRRQKIISLRPAWAT